MKKLLFLLLVTMPLAAQTSVRPFNSPRATFTDANGVPLANGCIFTYAGGTTTMQPTYTDYTGTTQNPDPVILDSTGSATMWLGPETYKFVAYSAGGTNCATGTQQWTVDQVPGSIWVSGTISGVNIVNSTITGSTIDGSIIGGTTPAAGNFTTLVAGTTTQLGISSYAELQAALGQVGNGTAVFTISGNIVPNTNLTIPKNVTIIGAGGIIAPPSGVTVTVAAPPMDTLAGLFGGAGTVLLPASTYCRPEWFAGANYGIGGTDYTTAIQDCVNALSTGNVLLTGNTYEVTGTISITKSNVGIKGVNGGYGNPSPTGVSIIESTSPSANIVNVDGASQSSKIEWNEFEDFALERSVVPTGSCDGLQINHVGGYTIDHVQSNDSIVDFYFHDAPNYGTGIVENNQAAWGYNGVTAYPSGLSLYGFYLDSTDGEAMDSMVFFDDSATSNNLTQDTSYGFELNGTAINDVFFDWTQTYLVTYGVTVNCQASASSCEDVHFTNSILDSSFDSSIVVNGIIAYGSVLFQGGWGYTGNTSASDYLVTITNSNNVEITGMSFYTPAAGVISITGGYGNTISQDVINALSTAVSLNGTYSDIITDNTITGSPLTAGVAAVNSSSNVITGNSISTDTGTSAITFDSASCNNIDSDNSFRGTWTTQIADSCTSFPPNGSTASYYRILVPGGGFLGPNQNQAILDDQDKGWNLSVPSNATYGFRFWNGAPGTTLLGQIDPSGNWWVGNGTTIVYVCLTSSGLPAGTLTTVATQCGSAADTGLRIK